MVRERLARLRTFTWSSYRAYAGMVAAPTWLQTATILELTGCGKSSEQTRAYRQYSQEAIRERLAESPWERLQGQAILGAGKFLPRMQEILSGNAREQPSLRRLARRANWETVVKAIERVKGEKWSGFVNRYGDWGRDMPLYLGRKRCQLKIRGVGALGRGNGLCECLTPRMTDANVFYQFRGKPIQRMLTCPVDTFELFAYSVEDQCFALGAQTGTRGKFSPDQEVEMDTSFGFGNKHKGHSAQFRSSYVKRAPFWNSLATKLNIIPQP